MTLQDSFFKSLEGYDLPAELAKYPGAFLAVAGSEDFSANYVPGYVDKAPGSPKEAFIVAGADHIYGVLGEDQTMADTVIDKTVAWFSETL